MSAFFKKLTGMMCFVFLTISSTPLYAVSENAFDAYILEASNATGVSKHLIKAVIKQESGFIDKYVTGEEKSSAGAIGAMQLLPSTALDMPPKGYFTEERLKNPKDNIMAGALYLKHLSSLPQIGNNLTLQMAAYNSGPNNPYTSNGQIPPYAETTNYVRKVAQNYANYAGVPPLNLASVPTAAFSGGNLNGTLPGQSPIQPSVNSDMAKILDNFGKYMGRTTASIERSIGAFVAILFVLFSVIQLFFFYKEGLGEGAGEFKDFISLSFNEGRTLFLMLILLTFIN